ncbi:MAG: epoxyqueuosine reductase QueH [Synergistetes bacterium]|nr:epoxyqueuosine reductase QueH [Synergistota bacterium]
MKRKSKVLLHICCAPDATYPFLELSKEFETIIGYFYGSNIHPIEEYERRKEALVKLSREWKFTVIFERYDPESWVKEMKGLEKEPEGGKRCEKCFRLQLERTALKAKELGIEAFTTTLTISPHKDVVLINSLGKEIAEKTGLKFIERIFRKKNGFKKSVELSKKSNLYRQNYCGCIFSIRKEEGSNGTG